MTNRLDRRAFLSLATAATLIPHAALAADLRLAVIDWGMLETTLALGVVPAAASELIQFRKVAVEPWVPETVSDLGLRGTPSYEMLRAVAPDLILLSGFYEYQRPSLERIAPVLSLPVFEAGKPPFALAERSALALGQRLGRAAEARAYVDQVHAELARIRQALTPFSGRPTFVVSLGDARHFRAFGGDSMFGDVLGRLGIANAWTDTTSYSAAAPVGLEALARVPDAAIAIIAPLPPEVGRTLVDNALWNALPAVRENRVVVLDPINHFGGLPSAHRFATLLERGWIGSARG